MRQIVGMRFFLLLLLIGFTSLAAETVYLRDGRVLTGRITSQTRTDITIVTPQGPMNIQKDQIRRIQYDTAAEDKAREDARKAEEARRLQEQQQRQAEEARKLQEQQQRQAEEQKRLEAEKKAQEQKVADQKKAEEEKRKAEEAKRQAEGESTASAQERKRIEEKLRRMREFDERARLMGPTWYGAVARNVAMPGWGEIYQGRKIGYLYAGAWAGLATFTLYEKDRYLKAKSVYSSTTRGFLYGTPYVARTFLSYSETDGQASFWFFKGYGQTSAARARMQKHALRLRFAQGALVALYGWTITDALLFKPTPKTAVGFSSTGDGMRLAVSTEF